MNARDLIVICLTIILLLSIGIFMMFFSGGEDATILTMTSGQTLNEGDSLILKLNDNNGSAIPNQRIEINLTHDDNGITENFTLKTNSKGECKLEDLPAGNFTLNAKYPGNKNYRPSSISGKITVRKLSNSNNSRITDNSTNKTSDTNETSKDKSKYKSEYDVDDVINGWDPSEHEVSREDLGDGKTRISYDDGYFRIVDKEGNIVSYGY